MAADLIPGINAYHADAAACIIRDGKLLAAAEERFRRIKHWAGFPSQAISYCLNEAKTDLSDVTQVAVNRSSRADFFRKLSYVAFKRPRAHTGGEMVPDDSKRSIAPASPSITT